MPDISILLPTRQRPNQLKRLVDSINLTADGIGDIELIHYVDNDDSSYEDLELDINWSRISGPRLHDGLVNLSKKWNECFTCAAGDILMHCGDDIVFRTPGWDTIVRDTFAATPDRILFAFGRDGYQDDNNFGTHGFIHRTWVETVGFFVPPYFVSDYNDTFLNDVSKAIGRHVEIDIFTEHMHYINGKAEIDQNTRERLERHTANDPGALYYSPEIQLEVSNAAEKLRAIIHASSQSGSNPEA